MYYLLNSVLPRINQGKVSHYITKTVFVVSLWYIKLMN